MDALTPRRGHGLRVAREQAERLVRDHLEAVPFPAVGAEALLRELTLVWEPFWRLDVHVLGGWTASVLGAPGWQRRAGSIDRWLDGIVVPAAGGPAPPSSAPLVELEGQPGVRCAAVVDADAACSLPHLLPAIGALVRTATVARALRDLEVEVEVLERTVELLAHPTWCTTVVTALGEVTVRVDGVGGAVTGGIPSSVRAARLQAALWAACGLGSLALGAVLVPPGLVLWPLLLVTLLASVVGFVCIAWAAVPLDRVRRGQPLQQGVQRAFEGRPDAVRAPPAG